MRGWPPHVVHAPGDWSLLPALVPGDVLFREVRVFRAHNVCVFSVRQFGIRF